MIASAFNFHKGYICAILQRTDFSIISKRLISVLSYFLLFAFYVVAQTEAVDTVFIPSRVTTRIDFKVNQTGWDTKYHGNDTILEKALTAIDSVVLDPHMRVKRITVEGTASPEGPLTGNIRLATNRAKTLTGILQNRYSFPDSIYTISVVPEDWEGMRIMLTEDNSIPHAETVLGFLDHTKHTAPDTRERQLKQLDGGLPYSSMLENVLPFLRRASVVIDCNDLRRYPVDLPKPDITVHAPGIQPGIRMRTSGLSTVTRRRFFALKTNLLGDLALCANLGLEVELWPHWSLDVPVWYSPYDITERWRIRLLATQPEVRYWPSDAGKGHYFGIHTSIVGFNVSTGGDYRYQDPNHAAFGLGLGYGYSFHLDKEQRWGLEAQIGAGYLSYKWVKYLNTGHNGAKISQGGGTYWGVTRAGITLSYKFYKERKGRRWMQW